ncbi:MAG: hypothetical protein N5P05_000409 [Chroococcopsis gigantea SAG 12.99]|jgi:hypothetical protein|nr:hypothetical protein [Chroococcopsis gigantea SAG 12.99]
MTTPNYKEMSRKDLKEYLLAHRNDNDAWRAFFEKLSGLDQNIGYSPNLSLEEMELDLIAK